MQSKIFLPVMALIFLLSACTDKTAKWRVKTEYHISKHTIEGSVYTSDGITRTPLYSNDGELTGQSLSNGNRVVIISSKTVDTAKTFNSRGREIETVVSMKNERGAYDSIIKQSIIDSEQEFNNDYQQKWIYDTEGNRIEVRNYKFNGTLEFVERHKFEHGLDVSWRFEIIGSIDTVMMVNPVTLKQDTIVQKVDGDTSTFYLFYYPKKESSSAYIKYLKEHWGHASGQLVKSRVEVSPKGDTVNISDYRYIFDEQNRVTSIVSEGRNHAEYDSTAYTYY